MCSVEILVSPFGVRILPHDPPKYVNLLPALPPLMGIFLLGGQVCNFESVAPFLGISPLVPHTVSFDCPFSGTFPVRDTTTFISTKYYDKFASTSKPSTASVSTLHI
jgi:hypothetical protein